ncbi:hypothetical protein Tco_0403281 [Tanacetum coccineum]|uniref:Uncharacterized protein n=1 Tax=Tanacetum coccineum TaxID=301880 RepID=A0ABQ5IK51_9ASTR
MMVGTTKHSGVFICKSSSLVELKGSGMREKLSPVVLSSYNLCDFKGPLSSRECATSRPCSTHSQLFCASLSSSPTIVRVSSVQVRLPDLSADRAGAGHTLPFSDPSAVSGVSWEDVTLSKLYHTL